MSDVIYGLTFTGYVRHRLVPRTGDPRSLDDYRALCGIKPEVFADAVPGAENFAVCLRCQARSR